MSSSIVKQQQQTNFYCVPPPVVLFANVCCDELFALQKCIHVSLHLHPSHNSSPSPSDATFKKPNGSQLIGTSQTQHLVSLLQIASSDKLHERIRTLSQQEQQDAVERLRVLGRAAVRVPKAHQAAAREWETPEGTGSPALEARKAKGSRANGGGTQHQNSYQQQRPAAPSPLDGRSHMDIQTDNYLEELTDRNPEVDVDTQTDALLDLHPPITFVPKASGVDVSTQIENGDLFDFDLEVESILEVLVGKTLEIGMLEVLEENELREIRQRQELFEQARNAELAEVQWLEAGAKRKDAEKQRRVDEEQKRVSAQVELEEKVAARAYAKRYLSDLHTQVFDSLVETGHFCDPMLKDVKEAFLPKVLGNAAFLAQEMDLARRLVEVILADTIKRRATAGS